MYAVGEKMGWKIRNELHDTCGDTAGYRSIAYGTGTYIHFLIALAVSTSIKTQINHRSQSVFEIRLSQKISDTL